jgi:malate dehydrogenase (oxaloacetate-decarboxylating)
MVINGAGAAGITIAKLLLAYGVKNIIICDSTGAIYRGRERNMNNAKKRIAELTNIENRSGSLKDVIKGTDVFIGVSIERALHGHWISTMNRRSIILAMANPIPEIMPDEAKAAGAYVYGSGRSDLENQINNSLVFPGIFKAIMNHNLK